VARALAVELASTVVDVRGAVAVHPRLRDEASRASIAGIESNRLEDGEHFKGKKTPAYSQKYIGQILFPTKTVRPKKQWVLTRKIKNILNYLRVGLGFLYNPLARNITKMFSILESVAFDTGYAGSAGLVPQSWVNGNGTSYIYFGAGEFDGQGSGHDYFGTVSIPLPNLHLENQDVYF
jgi:hypothetical protein